MHQLEGGEKKEEEGIELGEGRERGKEIRCDGKETDESRG